MKTVIEMARESGIITNSPYLMPHDHVLHGIERFAAIVAAAEREACVKVCKQQSLLIKEAMKLALAEPVQEPYAWVYVNKYGVDSIPASKDWCAVMVSGHGGSMFPLYTRATALSTAQPAPIDDEAVRRQQLLRIDLDSQPEKESIAALLLQSKKNHERNFGPSAVADWIYSDLLELLDTEPPQRQPLTEAEYMKALGPLRDEMLCSAGTLQLIVRALESAVGDKL
jgi:hypothetical protein